MADAPSLPREIPGKPLEGLPPIQPTVFHLPPGWKAQEGLPGKGCSAARGRCQRSPRLRQKDWHRSMLVTSVPSPLGTDPAYLL